MPTEKPAPSAVAMQLAAAIEDLDQAAARLLFRPRDGGLLSKVKAELEVVNRYCDAIEAPPQAREALANCHAELVGAVLRPEEGGDVATAVATFREVTSKLRDVCIVILNREMGP